MRPGSLHDTSDKRGYVRYSQGQSLGSGEERLGEAPILQEADGLDGQGLDAGEDLGLGGLQDAVEAAEQDEREDDSAVLRLLVVAAQQIGDGLDEAGKAAPSTTAQSGAN